MAGCAGPLAGPPRLGGGIYELHADGDLVAWHVLPQLQDAGTPGPIAYALRSTGHATAIDGPPQTAQLAVASPWVIYEDRFAIALNAGTGGRARLDAHPGAFPLAANGDRALVVWREGDHPTFALWGLTTGATQVLPWFPQKSSTIGAALRDDRVAWAEDDGRGEVADLSGRAVAAFPSPSFRLADGIVAWTGRVNGVFDLYAHAEGEPANRTLVSNWTIPGGSIDDWDFAPPWVVWQSAGRVYLEDMGTGTIREASPPGLRYTSVALTGDGALAAGKSTSRGMTVVWVPLDAMGFRAGAMPWIEHELS